MSFPGGSFKSECMISCAPFPSATMLDKAANLAWLPEWKRWEYQTTWSASWEICMQVRKQQLELDMEQHTGSK